MKLWIVVVCFCWLGFGAPNGLGQCDSPELAKVFASDADPGDGFGRAISLSGDRLIVGVPLESEGALSSGAAYVYRRVAGIWQEEAKLKASDADAGDEFGQSVSIDGDILIVGANGDDQEGNDAGAAYVFRFVGGSWVEEQKLVGSDLLPVDFFGWTSAISGDVAIVGAWLSNAFGDNSGAAYVFRFDGVTWNEEAKLIASDARPSANFGWYVAAEDDRVVVGAWSEDSIARDSGAAYVFRFTGGQWVEEAKLKASDAAADVHYGDGVALTYPIIAVGAKGDDAAGPWSGAAYVYRHDGSSWSEDQKLTASDAQAEDRFGAFLDASGDVVFVGAWRDDDSGANAGSGYVFRYDGTSWIQERQVRPVNAGPNDNVGWGVAVDGDIGVLGSRGDDDAAENAGAAYVFDVSAHPIGTQSVRGGSAGSGGLIPALDATVCDWQMTVELDNALGGAFSVLWAGLGITDDNPFYDGVFYIDFTLPFVLVLIPLQGVPGVPGDGHFRLPSGDLSGLAGQTLYVQCEIYDPIADDGRCFSNVMEIQF